MKLFLTGLLPFEPGHLHVLLQHGLSSVFAVDPPRHLGNFHIQYGKKSNSFLFKGFLTSQNWWADWIPISDGASMVERTKVCSVNNFKQSSSPEPKWPKWLMKLGIKHLGRINFQVYDDHRLIFNFF